MDIDIIGGMTECGEVNHPQPWGYNELIQSIISDFTRFHSGVWTRDVKGYKIEMTNSGDLFLKAVDCSVL